MTATTKRMPLLVCLLVFLIDGVENSNLVNWVGCLSNVTKGGPGYRCLLTCSPSLARSLGRIQEGELVCLLKMKLREGSILLVLKGGLGHAFKPYLSRGMIIILIFFVLPPRRPSF